jgi:hypothetical protein
MMYIGVVMSLRSPETMKMELNPVRVSNPDRGIFKGGDEG